MAAQLSGADQVGFVVDDLDAFLELLERFFGLKGFEVIEYPPEDLKDPQTIYLGQPAKFRLLMAFKKIGNIEFEVVQPLEGDSVFSDFLKNHGPGLHHIRFTEKDFQVACADLQSSGIPLLAQGKGAHGASTWAYFDTAQLLNGLFIELRNPG